MTKKDPELQLDDRNANKGTERGRELLNQSITELGAGRSILSDKKGKIIAGNKTLAAARKAGLKVRIVPTGRDELVVVQRQDLDLDEPAGEARRLAYLDNRVAELDLAWDAERLAEDIQAGLDLDGVGFLDKELQALLLSLEIADRKEVPEPEIEKADELIEKWKVENDQIWQLGEHRLAVGDCTDEDLVARLMGDELAELCWTDPPWNVNYGGHDHPSWKKRSMPNDNLGEKYPAFVQAFVKTIWERCKPGAILYMVMGAQEWPVVDRILREKKFHWSSTIVWVKDEHVLSRKDYHTQFEPLWYGWKGDAARVREVVDRKQSDVWLIERPKKSEEHPTLKPVDLVERSLLNSSLPGDLVLDPFVGAGTTLVTCERLGRICRAVELDLGFAAVTLERWHQMTDLEPERMAEA